jgi:hypothetical protein
MLQIDHRVRIGIGIVFLGLAVGVFIYGLTLKIAGENFSQYWVLALLLLWGGSDQIRKAFKPRSKVSPPESTAPKENEGNET